MLSRLFIAALWSPAGKGLTSSLLFIMSNCDFVTFPCGILGQVWHLIEMIPDLFRLSYCESSLSGAYSFVLLLLSIKGIYTIRCVLPEKCKYRIVAYQELHNTFNKNTDLKKATASLNFVIIVLSHKQKLMEITC